MQDELILDDLGDQHPDEALIRRLRALAIGALILFILNSAVIHLWAEIQRERLLFSISAAVVNLMVALAGSFGLGLFFGAIPYKGLPFRKRYLYASLWLAFSLEVLFFLTQVVLSVLHQLFGMNF